MEQGRRSPLVRVLKPIVAGMALAYFLTAFLDRPEPVHFQPDNPYASKQQLATKPLEDVVTDANIMKLGSPLSLQPKPDLTESSGSVTAAPQVLEPPTVESSGTESSMTASPTAETPTDADEQ